MCWSSLVSYEQCIGYICTYIQSALNHCSCTMPTTDHSGEVHINETRFYYIKCLTDTEATEKLLCSIFPWKRYTFTSAKGPDFSLSLSYISIFQVLYLNLIAIGALTQAFAGSSVANHQFSMQQLLRNLKQSCHKHPSAELLVLSCDECQASFASLPLQHSNKSPTHHNSRHLSACNW